MSATPAWPAAGQPFTVDELDLMPDDGRRYELLDGVLIVSPRPRVIHQEVAAELTMQLRALCPPDLRVIPEPAVQLTKITEFDPDIVVIRQEHIRDTKIMAPPLLIVEVRSPSTALIDLNRKKSAYAKFGVPSYWIVNPDPDRPELTVFELEGSEYREAGRVSGRNPFPAQKPFPVEIVPARLVAGLFPR
ncbi:MAG TPA: Uma2 family endonuclease [Streptosporangiaceae bacterium]